MSLTQKLSMLRFSSFLGVLSSILITIVVTFEFFNPNVVPNQDKAIKAARLFNFELSALVDVMPYIIFLYMFQPNVPLLYYELTRRNTRRMDKVLYRGSAGAVFVYLIIGVFGYLTFADRV